MHLLWCCAFSAMFLRARWRRNRAIHFPFLRLEENTHRLPSFVLFSLDPGCWLHGGIIKNEGRRLTDRPHAQGPVVIGKWPGVVPGFFSSFFSLTNVDDYDDVEIYDLANKNYIEIHKCLFCSFLCEP